MSGLTPGDRVRLLAMRGDPDPLSVGSMGTVLRVTEGTLGQIDVQWDSGRRLRLVPGVDEVEVVGHTDLVDEAHACPSCRCRSMDLLVWDPDFASVTCSLCRCTYEP